MKEERHMDDVAKIVEYIEKTTDRGSRTLKKIAANLGITRRRAYYLCTTNGIKYEDGRDSPDRKEKQPRKWTNRWGYERRLNSAAIGGACELIAAADAVAKGAAVYRAVTFVNPADLVFDYGGRLWRVEVKAAHVGKDGQLKYAIPFDHSKYDVLAKVQANGLVTYKPNIFEGCIKHEID